MNIRRIILSVVTALGCMIGAAGCGGSGSSSGNVETMTFADGDKIAVIEIEGYGTIKAKLFPDLAPIGVENFVRLADQGYYNGLKIHRVVKDLVIQGGSLNGDGTGGNALYTGNENSDNTTFGLETSEKARNFYGALCYVNDKGNNSTQFYIVNNKQPQDISKLSADVIKETAQKYADSKGTAEAGSEKALVADYFNTYYTNMAAMVEKADEKAIEKYKQSGGVPAFDGGNTVFGQVFEGFDVIDAISAVDVETSANGEKSHPTKDIVILRVTIETYKASATSEAEGSSKPTSSKPTSSKPSESGTESGSSPEASEGEQNSEQDGGQDNGQNDEQNDGQNDEQSFDTGENSEGNGENDAA